MILVKALRTLKKNKIVLKNIISNINADISFKKNIMPLYNSGEKIKIVFLFQVASFWPSWESFWNECINDKHLDVKMVLFDQEVSEKTQMKTARNFLEKNNIPFIDYKDYEIDKDKPHVLIMQTPYDAGHRPPYLWSRTIKSKGIRVVYIPYGIEISDTVESRIVHFVEGVPRYAWKVYTFSELIKKDYIKYSINGKKRIESLGHPKFDGLYNSEKFPLQEEIRQKTKNRKIVLWKVHFPKKFPNMGPKKKLDFITPEFEEYKSFISEIKNHPDLFFIFMPHPKFFEMCIFNRLLTQKEVEEIKNQLNSMENLYYYTEDDYRPGMLNADCTIVDRSAIMIEAAVTGKPILFMQHKENIEPMTKAIEGLINTYYQGSTCQDMIDFLEMFKRNEDPKKEQRLNAIKEYIPHFDGLSGKRIKDDIINSVYKENKIHTKESIIKFLKKKQFEKRIEKLAKKYKNKKIMFYGAGMVFDAVTENYNLSKLNIIGIADQKFQDGGEFKGFSKFSCDTFLNQKPDVVLINLLEADLAEDFFKQALYPTYGKFKYDTLIENNWDYFKEFFL